MASSSCHCFAFVVGVFAIFFVIPNLKFLNI